MHFKNRFLLSLTVSISVMTLSSSSVWADIQTVTPISTTPSTTKTVISGTDYFDTSVKVSQKGWETADTVILSTVSDFPDSLCGTSLAIENNAPIFFTNKDSVPSSIMTEISRLGAKKAIILGGFSVVSSSVESQLTSAGLVVSRLYGSDRFLTSVAIAKQVVQKSGSTTAFLGTSQNYPDELAAGYFAGKESNGSPILLTEKDNLNTTTKDALVSMGIKKVFILGGTAVLSQNIENQLSSIGISDITRLGGMNRYETSKKIIDSFNNSPTDLVLTTGTDFRNALIASSYGAKIGSPVMLYDNNVDSSINNYIANKNLTIIGNEITSNAINNNSLYSIYVNGKLLDIPASDPQVIVDRFATIWVPMKPIATALNANLLYDDNGYSMTLASGAVSGKWNDPKVTGITDPVTAGAVRQPDGKGSIAPYTVLDIFSLAGYTVDLTNQGGDGTINRITHIITINGNVGTGTGGTTGGTYTIISNNPSMTSTPDQMTNLQGLAKTLPSGVTMNSPTLFTYSATIGSISIFNRNSFLEMDINPTYVDKDGNPTAISLVQGLSDIAKACLYDSVSSSDADEILAKIQTFTTLYASGNSTAIAKYAPYIKTSSGNIQYSITFEGASIIVKWQKV